MAPKIDAIKVEKIFEELKLEISNISNDISHIIDQLKEQNKIQAVKIKSLNQEI